jgi:HEAT repeat protein
LIAKATDPDKNVRNQIAAIVRPCAEQSDAVRRLVVDTLEAEEMRLRFLAARCWPDTEPLEPVLPLLDDPAPSVRWAATSRVGWRVATGPADRDPAAIEALRKATRDAVPTVREEAFRGFWAVGLEAELAIELDAALDRIVEGLDDPSERVRLAAAIALRDRSDPRVLAPLKAALSDRSSWVRMNAVDGIVSADPGVGLAVAVAALHDRNREARINAAQTLGKLRDRRAIEPLSYFYARSTAVESRLAAVEALGQIRVKAAVPTLVEALADSTPDEAYAGPGAPYPVRNAAAKALRRIRTREAMEALRSSSF